MYKKVKACGNAQEQDQNSSNRTIMCIKGKTNVERREAEGYRVDNNLIPNAASERYAERNRERDRETEKVRGKQ
jgi:hypothetical protein